MESEKKPLRFRPHHFLCTLGYEGKGYSPEFVTNYDQIAARLKGHPAGDHELLEVTAGTADAICAPCPSRRGESCAEREKIHRLDEAHARVLGLQPGERLTWGEAKARIRAHFTLEKFHEACAPCAWKALGVCEKALQTLRSTPSQKTPLLLALLAGLALSAAASASGTPPSNFALENWDSPLAPTLSKSRSQAYRQLEASLAGKQKNAGRVPNDLTDLQRLLEIENPKTPPKKARALIWQALDEAPESPWTRRALESLPATELDEALALLKKNAKNAPALALLERATLRVLRRADSGSSATALPARALLRFTPEALEAFARRCALAVTAGAAQTPPPCAWTLGKLSEKFSSRSPEFLAIERGFPKLKELTRPSPLDLPTSRLTQAPKSIEPDVVAADEAIQRYLDSKTREEGLQKLRQFQIDYPRSPQRNRIRFWLLQAAEREGRDDEAQKLRATLLQENTYGWFGMLAASASEGGRWNPPILEKKAPKIRRDDPLLSPHERHHLQRAREALQAGAPSIARTDLKELKPRDTLSSGILLEIARLASRAGAHGVVFPVATELLQRSDPAMRTETARDLIFPVTEWPQVEAAARAAGIDPVLGLSLVKQESAFDPEAVSSSGALGYSQLMPFTALDVRAGVSRTDILEPKQNLEIGFIYLRKLLDRWKGNEALALASYNAGPAAVERWVRGLNLSATLDPTQGPPSPRETLLELAGFIDRIPYKETREYVGSILRNVLWYRSILNTQGVASEARGPLELSAFWRKRDEKAAASERKRAAPKN